jgi:hypothetical protein
MRCDIAIHAFIWRAWVDESLCKLLARHVYRAHALQATLHLVAAARSQQRTVVDLPFCMQLAAGCTLIARQQEPASCHLLRLGISRPVSPILQPHIALRVSPRRYTILLRACG